MKAIIKNIITFMRKKSSILSRCFFPSYIFTHFRVNDFEWKNTFEFILRVCRSLFNNTLKEIYLKHEILLFLFIFLSCVLYL